MPKQITVRVSLISFASVGIKIPSEETLTRMKAELGAHCRCGKGWTCGFTVNEMLFYSKVFFCSALGLFVCEKV